MAIQPASNLQESLYRRVIHNRAFMLLWSGQTISTVGDASFNLAVMWVVYTQSGSALQTAVIQVIWHLSAILVGPFAGTLADRWDRKRIMVVANILCAGVVGTLATTILAWGRPSSVVIFVAVFLLNSLTTFLTPARFSIMPEVVDRDVLATALGLFSTAGQAAFFLGNALAGAVIAAVGSFWAVVVDAASFVVAALSIAVAPLTSRVHRPAPEDRRPSLRREVADGWRAIMEQPVVRTLVLLGALINVASFTGPLLPALVRLRLNGGPTAYGLLEAVSIIGGVIGGALAGILERRCGAGRLVAMGWGVAGVCTLGVAVSSSLYLTASLEAILTFGLTVGAVSLAALMQLLTPDSYRGRVAGITGGLNAVAIPPSALVGGWLADILGPAALFAFGGAWILGVAGLAWSTRHVRNARTSLCM